MDLSLIFPWRIMIMIGLDIKSNDNIDITYIYIYLYILYYIYIYFYIWCIYIYIWYIYICKIYKYTYWYIRISYQYTYIYNICIYTSWLNAKWSSITCDMNWYDLILFNHMDLSVVFPWQIFDSPLVNIPQKMWHIKCRWVSYIAHGNIWLDLVGGLKNVFNSFIYWESSSQLTFIFFRRGWTTRYHIYI